MPRCLTAFSFQLLVVTCVLYICWGICCSTRATKQYSCWLITFNDLFDITNYRVLKALPFVTPCVFFPATSAMKS